MTKNNNISSAFGGFSAKSNNSQIINFYKVHDDLFLTLGTSGLPLRQTDNQNQTNNKQNIEDGVNSNSLFSRVQNHDNFPFLANTIARTNPNIAAGKFIVKSNNGLPSVTSGRKNTAPNHPAERFANQPDSTSNKSLSNNQDFIEQINRNISTSDFQSFGPSTKFRVVLKDLKDGKLRPSALRPRSLRLEEIDPERSRRERSRRGQYFQIESVKIN